MNNKVVNIDEIENLKKKLKEQEELHQLANEENDKYFIELEQTIEEVKKENAALKEKDQYICITKCAIAGAFFAIVLGSMVVFGKYLVDINSPVLPEIYRSQSECIK